MLYKGLLKTSPAVFKEPFIVRRKFTHKCYEGTVRVKRKIQEGGLAQQTHYSNYYKLVEDEKDKF